MKWNKCFTLAGTKLDLIDMKCMPLKPSKLWSYIVQPEFRKGLDREV